MPCARRAPLPPRPPSPHRSVGHKGKFGHEFMELEIKADGTLRYANNSNYKNDVMIRKEGAGLRPVARSGVPLASPPRLRIFCCVFVRVRRAVKLNHVVLGELRRILEESEIMK